ncbi:MAG: hypothetical protein SWQ30_14355 [Thermodesulfobacteriota bacterium]|nr:hypothetical protein [Thermodesulfobacteriota bacterium]
MRVNKDDARQMRKADQAALSKLGKTAEEIKAQRIGEVEDRYNQIQAKIKSLQEQKRETLVAASTKQLFLEAVKARARASRQDLLEKLLGPAFEEWHRRNWVPFEGPGIKLKVLQEENLWRLLFLCITDNDLESLVEKLPDIGITEEERQAEIERLDKEITKLSDQLEKEFRGLPR